MKGHTEPRMMRPAFRWSTASGKTRLPDTSANVVPVVPVTPVALIAPGHAQAPPGPPPGATMPDRAGTTPESGNAPRSIRDLPLRSGRGSLRRRPIALPRRAALTHIGASERIDHLEAIAAAVSDYRRLVAAYLAQQIALAQDGVGLDDLVCDTWEDFEQVAAEVRLFAAVDDLKRKGG
jgi:hypothetical protein